MFCPVSRFTGVTLKEYLKDQTEKRKREAQAESTNPFEEELDKSNPFFSEDNESSSAVPQKDVSTDRRLLENFEVAPFQGLISKCFEPYLYIYIESQDQALTDLGKWN